MDLKTLRAAAVKAAQDIAAGAKAAARPLTADELGLIEAKSAEVKTIDEQIARASKAADLLAAIGDAAPESPVVSGAKGAEPKTVGQAVAVAAKSAGARRGSRIDVSASKAASDVHVTDQGVREAFAQNDTAIVTGPRRRLTVSDVLGTEVVSGDTIRYFVEGAREGSPAATAENGEKADVHYAAPTAVVETLTKVTAFLTESDELIEDQAWLASTIDNRLVYDVELAEEDELLAGDGTGASLVGLLEREGVQTATSTAAGLGDAIFAATTAIETGANLTADAIILHPADYQKLRLSKDANGQYFGGGLFGGNYGTPGGPRENAPVWGLRTVVTPAIPAGTVLVGAFAQATSVVRKANSGVVVEATNSHGEDFKHDRISIRAEKRLALAVRRPAGLVKITVEG